MPFLISSQESGEEEEPCAERQGTDPQAEDGAEEEAKGRPGS